MSCWLTKTAFQVALILILIVAVPFLIAMIITYVYFGLNMAPESERCEVLCCSLDTESHEKGADTSTSTSTSTSTATASTSTTTLPPKETQQADQRSLAQTQSPVVALLEDLHKDDEDEQVFKCPGVVMSKGWILTTGRCVKSGVTSVRVGSKYWSKDGTVSDIGDVHYSNNGSDPLLVVLSAKIPGTRISFGHLEKSEKIWSVTWNSNLSLPLTKKKKHEEMVSRDVDYYQKVTCGNETAQGLDCYVSETAECDLDSDGVMLNENEKLVGFHVATTCPQTQNHSVVSYIDIHRYIDWIYSIVD